MAKLEAKRFESADEVRPFTDGKGRIEVVELAGSSAARGVFEPGWRWSQHVKPLSQTDTCEVEHVGVVMEGRMKVEMDNGEELELKPGDAFHIPPGHDAWIVGEEQCVLLDFAGMPGYARSA